MRQPTPDPLGHDDVLTKKEALDEDDMGVDPLEGGMDPAEGWSASKLGAGLALHPTPARCTRPDGFVSRVG